MVEEDLITITNLDDIIDSREVIARMDQTDDPLEYDRLNALAKQCEAIAKDWEHGEVLIRDDHFKTYAIDLAESCEVLPFDCHKWNSYETTWPLNCIDWNCAADLLQEDYMSVDFDGVRYWIR
jgi:hypothetical protein